MKYWNQIKKLKYWIQKRGGLRRYSEKYSRNVQEIPYIDLSGIKISEYQESLLKKGPKYIINEKIDLRETILKVEAIIERLPEHERDRVRNELQKKVAKRTKQNDIDSEDRIELEKLRKIGNIAVLHTDKTVKMVIMNRKEYVEMMERAIGELQVEKLTKDPKGKGKEFD